jgi:sugar phosphate isomerase/epimerase
VKLIALDHRFTRMEFLRVAAAGAAFWAAGRGSAESGPGAPTGESAATRRIPIGLQLYSVRNECAKDFPAVLAAVAAMGYEGVEFAGYHGRNAAELKKLLDDSGLKSCGTHLGIDQLTGDELQRTVEFNRTLGNEFLIVASLPDERMADRQACLATARAFNEISQQVEAAGMRVGYHNHASDLRPLDGETAGDIFFANTRPEVVMQVDTANMLAGGGDPVQCLRKYPGRADTMHLKEHSSSNPAVLLGEGDIEWRSLFDVVRAQGATEWFIVEYEGDAPPPLVAVQKCLANLKKMTK